MFVVRGAGPRAVCGALEVPHSPPCFSSLPGLAQAPLPCVQDTASQVEAEVAARVLRLETEHKLKLSLLQTELKEEIDVLKLENRSLREKLQEAISLKEDWERVSVVLASAAAESCEGPAGPRAPSPAACGPVEFVQKWVRPGPRSSRGRVWLLLLLPPASRVRGLAGRPQTGGRLVGTASGRPRAPWGLQWYWAPGLSCCRLCGSGVFRGRAESLRSTPAGRGLACGPPPDSWHVHCIRSAGSGSSLGRSC